MYNVEKIIKMKRTKEGDLRYLVKWEGYGSRDNTWEPAWSFQNFHFLENFW